MEENGVELFVTIVAGAFVVALMFWLLFYLPITMAKRRGRSPIGWVLLFWFITPLWGVIALMILGDSRDKIRQDILSEVKSRCPYNGE